jgi:hypothetical protein
MKVFIEVYGGLVVGVYSDTEMQLDFVVLDHDLAEQNENYDPEHFDCCLIEDMSPASKELYERFIDEATSF